MNQIVTKNQTCSRRAGAGLCLESKPTNSSVPPNPPPNGARGGIAMLQRSMLHRQPHAAVQVALAPGRRWSLHLMIRVCKLLRNKEGECRSRAEPHFKNLFLSILTISPLQFGIDRGGDFWWWVAARKTDDLLNWMKRRREFLKHICPPNRLFSGHTVQESVECLEGTRRGVLCWEQRSGEVKMIGFV